MSKIIFHIGTHKTGTTSIQNRLSNNRKKLLDQGILYPKSGVGYGHSGHHELAWAIAGQSHRLTRKNADTVCDEVKSAIAEAGDKTVIFSSEEFGNLNPQKIQKMKSFLDVEDAEVIVYLRNQVDYLIAQYKQHIQQYETRYSGSLFDYIVEFNILNRMAYAALVTGWANSFGKESINIRVYDRSVLINGDVVEDFFNAIGVNSNSIENTNSKGSENKSISDFAAEILRHLNRSDVSRGNHQKMVDEVREASQSYTGYTLVDHASAHRIWNRFWISNERLREHFGVDVDALNKAPSLEGKVTISQSNDPVIKALTEIIANRGRL